VSALGTTALRQASAGSGEDWSTLGTFDFSGVGAADWRSSGSAVVGGVTFSAINGSKCAATFGPDGSTGIRIVQTKSGTIEAGNAPGMETALSNIGTVADGDELCLDLRISGTSAADFGRVVGALIDTDYVAAGVMYRSVPGQWEIGSISASSQYTDPSLAVSDSSDAVFQLVFTASGVTVFDRGSWSGSFPTDVGGTVADAVGTEAGSGRTTYKPRLSAATLRIVTYRSTGSTDATIHGLRVRKRIKGA